MRVGGVCRFQVLAFFRNSRELVAICRGQRTLCEGLCGEIFATQTQPVLRLIRPHPPPPSQSSLELIDSPYMFKLFVYVMSLNYIVIASPSDLSCGYRL